MNANDIIIGIYFLIGLVIGIIYTIYQSIKTKEFCLPVILLVCFISMVLWPCAILHFITPDKYIFNGQD
jgi:ABC-type polysaccharide transport system permease subunit